MKRPVLVWLAFAACALIGLGVLAWFSLEMMRLDRGAAQAREIAAREENVRLALWRMDSALASIHGLESSRPVTEYEPFVATTTTFTPDLHRHASDRLLVPSPLLGFTPPFIRLHVQLLATGEITSPQVPDGAAREAARSIALTEDRLGERAERLQQLQSGPFAPLLLGQIGLGATRGAAGQLSLLAEPQSQDTEVPKQEFSAMPTPSAATAAAPVNEAVQLAPQAARQTTVELRKSQAEQQQRAVLADENYYVMNRARQQDAKTLAKDDAPTPVLDAMVTAEAETPAGADTTFSKRERVESGAVAAAAAPAGSPPAEARRAAPARAAPAAPHMAPAISAAAGSHVPVAGPLQVAWAEGELFFVRSITDDPRVQAQAVWLDWPELRAWLLGRVTDLLPAAKLEPIATDAPLTADDTSRRLAFLPVRLRPGPIDLSELSSWSPLHSSLTIAWTLAGIGIVALALLLAGTLRLSERRGAFVSAVTHELRTPLTTFRMYTEMLSSGMVPDEAKRRSYVDTLRKEAERLSHLVENVLSYARLERGRASSRVEETTAGDLFARMEERLRHRAQQGGLTLTVVFGGAAADLPLRTDTTAFEQIVFNLVDNAAKYARRPGAEGALTIEVSARERGRIAVRVEDDGPGIGPSVRRRLFQPFSKSAAEAAHSQPGVGLGLALSRRLARDELHGDLVLESTGPTGTVFRLDV